MSLIHCTLDRYASTISTINKHYDVIVIDGEINQRYKCTKLAINHLNDNGMIILDNSDWLKNSSQFLRHSNLIQVDFAGPGPINDYFWCTSIFLTRNFNFPSLNKKRPSFIPGGIQNIRD